MPWRNRNFVQVCMVMLLGNPQQPELAVVM
jgi:hypothetical protein